MKNLDDVEWILVFVEKESTSDEEGFPPFEFGHPNRAACVAAGDAVLRTLVERGETREWVAYGHPDPWEKGAAWDRGEQGGPFWRRRLSEVRRAVAAGDG